MTAVIAAVAVICGGAALYGIAGPDSNAASTQCGTAPKAAAALDALATGEVAAFQLAAEPEYLGGLTFRGENGEGRALSDFAGKTLLVNVWATWCAPCRREMPALDRLQAAEADARFAVMPISIDLGSRDKPAAFLKSVGASNLPLLTDPSTEIFNDLKRRSLALGLPVTLLIDPKGCLLGHINGPAEWDSADGVKLVQAAKEGA